MSVTNREKLKALKIKSKGSAKKNLAVFLILALIIGVYAVHAWDASKGNTKTQRKTEVEKLISKDLETSYPGTPREVMRFYSRILKCCYNQKLTEEQVESLATQMRCLFDMELLEQNPKETYLENLKVEIQEYKNAKKTITSYAIDESSNVEERTIDGEKYATIHVSYTTRSRSQYEKVYEEFMMRRDSDKNWKIVGWKQVTAEEAKMGSGD